MTYHEEMKAEPNWQEELLRPGFWHSHGDQGFWRFIPVNEDDPNGPLKCAGCGKPWAKATE